ncbi:response regulator [Oligoflexus tunisiensis]|uniref:response regulator n=1 Tax=Oligoflexus tunisiensis TaxID=708132 RepID=UPI00159EFE8F|nr:response regulator [Oligoflexus tunisiensis]
MDSRLVKEKTHPGPDGRRTVCILLVEDNRGDARLIQTLLREFGTNAFSLDVHVASDGEAAIDFLLQRGEYSGAVTPSAVILDINLPKKSGFDVLTEMRKHPRLRRMPVFILTTSNAHEDILKGYSLDAVSFITKPSSLAGLEDAVRMFLAVELPRVIRED